jgi:hypothetical protein
VDLIPVMDLGFVMDLIPVIDLGFVMDSMTNPKSMTGI